MSDQRTVPPGGTETVVMVHHAADLLELRFTAERTITLEDLQGVIARLDRHGLAAMRRLLVTLPDQEVSFEMQVVSKDHLASRPAGPEDRVMAIVTSNESNDRLARLYFAWFPARFRTRHFRSRAEALLWLAEHGPSVDIR